MPPLWALCPLTAGRCALGVLIAVATPMPLGLAGPCEGASACPGWSHRRAAPFRTSASSQPPAASSTRPGMLHYHLLPCRSCAHTARISPCAEQGTRAGRTSGPGFWEACSRTVGHGSRWYCRAAVGRRRRDGVGRLLVRRCVSNTCSVGVAGQVGQDCSALCPSTAAAAAVVRGAFHARQFGV